jgi:hypothetical protein
MLRDLCFYGGLILLSLASYGLGRKHGFTAGRRNVLGKFLEKYDRMREEKGIHMNRKELEP